MAEPRSREAVPALWQAEVRKTPPYPHGTGNKSMLFEIRSHFMEWRVGEIVLLALLLLSSVSHGLKGLKDGWGGGCCWVHCTCLSWGPSWPVCLADGASKA